MIAMDKVHSIRQLFYKQGKSVSAIAAETGVYFRGTDHPSRSI